MNRSQSRTNAISFWGDWVVVHGALFNKRSGDRFPVLPARGSSWTRSGRSANDDAEADAPVQSVILGHETAHCARSRAELHVRRLRAPRDERLRRLHLARAQIDVDRRILLEEETVRARS